MKNKSRESQRSLDFLRDDFKTSTSQDEILDGSHVRGESRYLSGTSPKSRLEMRNL